MTTVYLRRLLPAALACSVVATAVLGVTSIASVEARIDAPAPAVTARATPHMDRSGSRAPLLATPIPSESVAGQTAKHTRTRPEPARSFMESAIVISIYKDCSGHPQRCIDAGTLTFYGGRILAGHNYMGYTWLARVATGELVRVNGGPADGTYRVYGHRWLNRQGGAIPDFGERAALVLQTCVGSGTGFSLLERVR